MGGEGRWGWGGGQEFVEADVFDGRPSGDEVVYGVGGVEGRIVAVVEGGCALRLPIRSVEIPARESWCVGEGGRLVLQSRGAGSCPLPRIVPG